MITKLSFDFLKKINKNNQKEWFDKNRKTYEASHLEMIAFAEALMAEMNKHDRLIPMTGKKSLYRIYRDVRFSKDKTPYKSHWGGRMKRDTDFLRGGYFYNIEPGNSYVAAGFWRPNPHDMKLIRDNIALDAKELRKILSSRSFKSHFGEIRGEQVKSAPRGYDKNHPNIDLLRYKQFIVTKSFSDAQVLNKDFAKQCSKSYQAVRPFFDYMSYILTHDLNGVAIY